MRPLLVVLALIIIGSAAASAAVLLAVPAGTDLGTLWHAAAPESLNLAQAVTQRYIHPVVWTHVLLPVLLAPASVVFALVAVATLVAWLTLRRFHESRRRKQYVDQA